VAASGTAPYAFNTMHPIPWVAGMFLGYRGGLNVNVTVHSDKYGFVDDIKASRVTDSAGSTSNNRYFYNFDSLSTTATASSKSYFLGRKNAVADGVAGFAVTSNRTNSTVSFNLPDFNNRNFSLVDPSFYVVGSSVDGTDEQGALLDVKFAAIDNTTDNGLRNLTMQSAVGAGADWTNFVGHYRSCYQLLQISHPVRHLVHRCHQLKIPPHKMRDQLGKNSYC